jgi:hypothetical protein
MSKAIEEARAHGGLAAGGVSEVSRALTLTLASAETIGTSQYAVIMRARRSIFKPVGGFVSPNDFLERRACKRLEARGLLAPAIGYPDCWTLTERGRECWLRVVSKGEK